jgi:hypothetical protein
MERMIAKRWAVCCLLGAWLGQAPAMELGPYGIMPISPEALGEARALHAALPAYESMPGYVGEPGAVNLLTNVVYQPSLRDQGRTGSCWMWGCQAVMWLDYARQFPEEGGAMTNGFSLQFMSSYLRAIDEKLNMGGTPWTFMRFHRAMGYAIPWGNANAAWTDGGGHVATPPSHIYTQPRVPVESMKLTAVKTFGEPTEDAVVRIKSVLDSGRALYFNMMLANDVEWGKFLDFWGKSDANESTLFTNYVSGETINFTTGGAHLMACVGYDDTDPDPARHYWIILNSWATGDSAKDDRRPNGVWRLPMQMDYGAYTYDFMADKQAAMFEWGILDTAFGEQPAKGVQSIRANLGGSDPAQNVIELTKGTVTAPGVIDGIESATIYVNERYYRAHPEQGVWRQTSPTANTPPKGHVFEYQSNAGVEPSIWLQIDVLDKTWSFRIAGLGPDDHRFINLHDGLYFYATFDRGQGSGDETLAEHRGFAFDELADYVQDSGIASSGNPPGSLTFTRPAPGAEVPVGGTCAIEWEHEGLDGKMVSIQLTGFGEFGDASLTLAGMVPVEAGRIEWEVPRDVWLDGHHALVAVVGAENPKFDGPAISLVASSEPALVVRSPAGGEGWTTGGTYRVSWEAYNLEGDVAIELVSGGVAVPGSSMHAPVGAEGASYVLPEGLPVGDYAVRFAIGGLSVTSATFAVVDRAPEVKPWSVLIYFQSDNNLEPSHVEDFLDVAKVGSTSNMHVVAQMDRIAGYHVGYGNWTGAKRFCVAKGMTPTAANAVQDLGEVSMARPGTLLDFIHWAVEQYPAEKYFLILADHGDGWQGALWESTPNMVRTPQPMGLFEQALKQAPAAMDIVGFDACLMGQVESAYQLRETGAGLFIGSQYVETMGWAYAEFLQELDDGKGRIEPWALAARVCELSVAKYGIQDPAALTVVDLSRMDDLAAATAGFVDAVLADPENRAAIREQAGKVSSNYYAAIVHHAANRYAELATTGLNVHFRPDRALAEEYVDAGLDFAADARWVDFLRAYTNVLHDTWIGEARRFVGDAADIDLMSFIHAIHPPDDAAWISFSTAGNGIIQGQPTGRNLMARKGDVVELVGIGAEPAHMMPGTQFVRWWVGGDAELRDDPASATNALIVNGHAAVVAYFAEERDEYRVTFVPVGSGTINGMAEEFQVVVSSGGATPPMHALAAAGHVFGGWGGAVDSTNNPLVLEGVVSDMGVFAFFWPVPEQWIDHADASWWLSGQNAFVLSTPEQLAGLAALVNGGTDSFAGKTVRLGASLDLAGKEWTPIGTHAHPFAGSFNGQGYGIDGLSVLRGADADSIGLFGKAQGAGDVVFENVHLRGATLVGGSFVGALAGEIESLDGSATLRNCSSHGSVWGHGALVGGLVGEVRTGMEGGGAATVSNAHNRASVRGRANSGGVLGRALARGTIHIADCVNEGAVLGADAEVGGIAGAAISLAGATVVERCYNAGSIGGDAEAVGGIAGRLSGGDCILDASGNAGDVAVHGAGNAYAGGVVGWMGGMLPDLKNCRNAGQVRGHAHVGGIAGLAALSVKNSSNEGRIEGDDVVGGIAGTIQGEYAGIENCHNAGIVVGAGRVGGVAGRIGTSRGAAANAVYFLQTPTANAGLDFVGEMVPATNYADCAVFADVSGALSANGYGGRRSLANALNAWVTDYAGAVYWATSRDGAPSHPWPDPDFVAMALQFRANGGTFADGSSATNIAYSLGRPYGAFPEHPANPGHAFVGWWHRPEPHMDPVKLQPAMAACPSVPAADAYWSATTRAATPMGTSVETLAEYYPQVAHMDQAQIDALALGAAANQRDRVWELLHLGLDPTDPDAEPSEVQAYVTSPPLRVHAVPAAPIAGVSAYAVQGVATLADADWIDLGPLGADLPDPYRFFRLVGQ